jgi:hypothetical protein
MPLGERAGTNRRVGAKRGRGRGDGRRGGGRDGKGRQRSRAGAEQKLQAHRNPLHAGYFSSI